MTSIITEYCTIIIQYGCLIIYALSVSIGLCVIITFLATQLVKRVIGIHDFYRGFEYYLIMKRIKNDKQI